MLIILSKSPWSQNNDSILKIASSIARHEKDVAILHIQDACIAATINEYCKELVKNNIAIYALKADCETRGLTSKIHRTAKLIDYKQWVKLVMTEHENIVSYTS